jgi:hypothetical protein
MFGRPPIASAIAGLKERITDGVNGFTFPVRDARALGDLMASRVGNEAQWKRVNAAIEPPWTDIEMLESYASVWQEFAEKRDKGTVVAIVAPPPVVRARVEKEVAVAEDAPARGARTRTSVFRPRRDEGKERRGLPNEGAETR